MKYVSTREGFSVLTFEETLFSGFLSDGGLAMPQETIRKLSEIQLQRWTTEFSYPQIVSGMLQYFIDEEELDHSLIEDIVNETFKKFDSAEIIPMKQLSRQLFVGELFHGPTLAFKDLALSILGTLMNHFLEKTRKHVTVLVGTSGDTGSAAIHALKDSKWLDIIVLFPKGRCSQIQELQMTTVLDRNVHLFQVEGTSDDLDVPIRACFGDLSFVKEHNLCSVNSINWVRILVQAAHFFYLYGKVCSQAPDNTVHHPVTFIIPTGAAGHLTAGLLAQRLGLPINLVCCVNANDVLHKAVTTGKVVFSGCSQATLACAMDIQAPYNMERIMYMLSYNNNTSVKLWMELLETNGEVQLSKDIHEKLKESFHVHKVSSNDAIKSSMAMSWKKFQYGVCPHTATAMDYFFQLDTLRNDHVVLATASPSKFLEAQYAAGLVPDVTLLEKLQKLPTKFRKLKFNTDWESIIKSSIKEISELQRI